MIGHLKVTVELKTGVIVERIIELEDINSYWLGGIPDQDLIEDIDADDIEDLIVEEIA
jgi:hypothetical protein